MSDEAVLKVETHIPVNFTCSTLVTIEKGAICTMSDKMTAATTTAANGIVAGIAQSEKLAADTTQDSIAIYRGGIFRVNCCGSVGVGDPVNMGARVNSVKTATANEENIIGIMMEAGTDNQTKLMELRPTTMQLA